MPVPDNDAAGGYRSRDANLGGVQAESLLPVRPNFPFFLVHYPENWEVGIVDGVAWWLPGLQHDIIEPGVNNKKTIKRGMQPEEAYDESHMRMTRKGAVILPLNIVVPVTDAEGKVEHVRGYLKEVDCQDPKSKRRGVFYHEAWQRPKPPRRGKRQKWSFDHNAFNRYRLALVSHGLIQPPHPDLIDERKARATYHVQRQSEKVLLPADVRERLKAESEVKADAIENAMVPDVGSTPAQGVQTKLEAGWRAYDARQLAKAIADGDLDDDLDEVKSAEEGRTRPRSSVTKALAGRINALAVAGDEGGA